MAVKAVRSTLVTSEALWSTNSQRQLNTAMTSNRCAAKDTSTNPPLAGLKRLSTAMIVNSGKQKNEELNYPNRHSGTGGGGILPMNCFFGRVIL